MALPNDISGSLGFGADSQDAANKRRKIGRKLLGKERDRLRQLFGQSEGFLLEALSAREEGFDQAKGAVLDAGRASRTRAIGLGQQAQADANASLAGTGRGGTTLVSTTTGGVSAQVAEALASIDAETSRLFGGVSIQAGQSKAQGLEGLAQLQQQLFAAEAQSFFDPKFNLFTGTELPGDSALSSKDIAAIAAAAIGASG